MRSRRDAVRWTCGLAFLALAAWPAVAQPAGEAPKKPELKALSAEQKTEIRKLLADLYKATEDDKAKEIREKLAAYPPISREEAAGILQTASRLAAAGFLIPGGASFEFPIDGQKGTVHMVGGGRGKGLFIGLHGGGPGEGDGRNAMQLWPPVAGCAALYPTILPKITWVDALGHRYVLGLIEAAKRTWGVDTTRIYVAGHSMGGFGAWSIGAQHADLFAAVASGAGGGYEKGVPRNMFNTPMYFYHSTDDPRVGPASDQANAKELAAFQKANPGGYVHVYQEYKDIQHGIPKTGHGPILQWMAQHKRNPYPKKLAWEPNHAWKKQFAWLFSESPKGHVGDGEGIAIEAAYVKPNELEIKCPNPAGLVILFHPKLVDFNKPLKVKVNGEQRFHGFVTASVLACALSAARTDPQQQFLGHLKLE